jgi:three-Cys-motif partner protein
MEREAVLGSDGLPARAAGSYARKKLDFIQFFAPAAIDAAARKRRRIYVDLFAGPGLYLQRDPDAEVESGALALLRSRGARHPGLSFTHAHLVNLDRSDHDALRTRVDRLVSTRECLVPASGLRHHLGDANLLARKLITQADKPDYVLVVAEIEAPRQLPWETVRGLRMSGHKSVDLCLLFPLDLGFNRLPSLQEMPEGHEDVITRFFGDEAWKPILTSGVTEASAPECRWALEELYLAKLRGMWEKAERVMQVKLRGERGLHRMIFATDHAAGARIADWARSQADQTDQLGFGL